MGRRWILIVLVLLVAGCGGDDDKAVEDDPKTVGTTTAEKAPPESTGTGTDTGAGTTAPPRETTPRQRTTPPEVLTSGPRRDVARKVGELIQAVELGDGPSFCRALGRDPGGAQGVEALRACGRQAGIDPFRLPTSDEFSVTSVEVRGSRATAKLGGGQTVVLRRAGKRWQIVSFRP